MLMQVIFCVACSAVHNGQTEEVFYGKWEITKLLAWPPITDKTKEEDNLLLGTIISYSSDEARSGNNNLDNPFYKSSLLSKGDFEIGYRISFDKLCINDESITKVMVYQDDNNEIRWNDLGHVFFIKDKDTLILWDGECYEMKRIE
jgi:hypothetical protein